MKDVYDVRCHKCVFIDFGLEISFLKKIKVKTERACYECFQKVEMGFFHRTCLIEFRGLILLTALAQCCPTPHPRCQTCEAAWHDCLF